MATMAGSDLRSGVAALARRAQARGWALGTSGNFSAVVGHDPLRIAITASGVDKGRVTEEMVVEIDGGGAVVRGHGRPSAETAVHLAIVQARGAGAVAHTHSPWSTLLSDAHAAEGGLALEGYEMLKALAGVTTHLHREWLPIVENTQDWEAAAPRIAARLESDPALHGFLIRRHGLYTWGRDLEEAERHLEALEFLLEIEGVRGARGAGYVSGPAVPPGTRGRPAKRNGRE